MFQKDFLFKIIKKTSDHISVLSDQNGDLVGHMSFQERSIICSPAMKKFKSPSSVFSLVFRATDKSVCQTCKEALLKSFSTLEWNCHVCS